MPLANTVFILATVPDCAAEITVVVEEEEEPPAANANNPRPIYPYPPEESAE